MCQRIAIFDYRVTSLNPIGSRHLKILEGLCGAYDFTVFAVEFENPCPERIRWVRIPAPIRPYALLFVAYHLMAPIYYLWLVLRTRKKFDLLQFVESNLSFGDVAYAHFCHRAYLKNHWSQSKPNGFRGAVKWLGHWLPSLMEPRAFGKARTLVVPSEGLARELSAEYPRLKDKILVLSNSIDVEPMQAPDSFDRDAFRSSLPISKEDVALIFLAQGHHERKGLPQLIEALGEVSLPTLKLLVVGGKSDTLSRYRRRVAELHLEARVLFLGWVPDIRPYMWASDGFALPSFYETFSLVSFEAAAAGLPLIVTPLSGVEEFLLDGENGFLVQRSSESLSAAIRQLAGLTAEERRVMGDRARQSVMRFSSGRFLEAWRNFYASA